MHLYVLTNTVNGKRYVGQTVGPLAHRIAQHRRGHNANGIIGKAIAKYGWDQFSVQSCEVESIDLLNEIEEFAIAEFGALHTHHGYNIKMGGDNHKGHRHTIAARKKIADAATGKRHTQETINGMRERQSSPERVALTKAVHTGRKRSPETCRKISLANMGKTISDEAKAKLRAANLGKKASDETRAKLSAIHKGRKKPPVTDEWRRKQRIAHLGQSPTPEARARMSASAKTAWARRKSA